MQDSNATPSSVRAMAHAPECIVVLANGSRRCVDLFTRSTDWAAALEIEQVHAIEFSHFRFDKHLSLEQLDRLFGRVKASRLRSLVVEDCVLTDRVVAFVVETFVRANQLASLVVRHCRQVSMTSIMALTSLVKAAPSLVIFDLSSCLLSRQAGILLGQALQTSRSLKRIDISGNNLRDGGLKAIADGMRAAQVPNESFDEFDCSSNGISATGLASLVGIQVKRLVASDNSVRSLLASVISNNRLLESLDLSGNSFAEDAMRELLTQALQAPRLTSLNIQNCNLSQVNEEFLAKTLLFKAKTTKGCALQELFLGDKPDVGDLLDSGREDDMVAAAEQDDRLSEFKRCLEARVPGLAVHLLDSIMNDGAQERRREGESEERDDHDDCEPSAAYDVELETPGRQLRRELLERTEFMRRHSEELPLADDDESLASFVSDKLRDKCVPPKPIPRSTTASTFPGSSDGENDMLSVSRRASAMTSSFSQPRQLHHSASNASFFLNNTNPSLDDVASQFSIDPPPSAMTSTLQNMDVEFIVSRTIETMNRNFEQRLTQFLMRMEFQQQEKNATQLQMLSAKVEACERAIPRLEARLDVLADRIATSGAQVAKMQTEWHTKQTSSPASISTSSLSATTPLSVAMQTQVDELVASRLRASESQLQGDVASLRREVVAATAAAQIANPRAVVDAVSVHLTQFKQEFDANQANVLRRFTENIVRDGSRVDERMQQLEGKVAHLEGIIQAEQHASLLALEAISEAFTGNNNAQSPPAATPYGGGGGGGGGFAPVAPLPPPPPQQHQPPTYISKPIQQHGYTMAHR